MFPLVKANSANATGDIIQPAYRDKRICALKHASRRFDDGLAPIWPGTSGLRFNEHEVPCRGSVMSNSIDFSYNGAFDPVAIKAMEEAFELACVTLKKRQQADE